ncbi:hypothetical protein CBM2586_B130483 [Cupriavidus phytorum]|uniref:Uncharacterized protein n=1 Tax=Cupriavidus taiwanensis TaxID=164546 RepID=A0A375CJ66_9BURK|nr:hypothetical protein CBM2586_B130483 [Cupriavidus taiwanensis]
MLSRLISLSRMKLCLGFYRMKK